MIPTVVLLAAGMSTRYGRLKQLEPVGPGGEALLDFAVFDALRAGFPRVLLVIREELEEIFRAHMEGRWPADLEVVVHHQRMSDLPGVDSTRGSVPSAAALLSMRRKPWGTAHAILTARDHLPGPFVVLNADDFYGESAFHQASRFLAASTPSRPDTVSTFGLVTYTLQDTLSEHGGVSRGLCRVDSRGWLEGVQEVLEIRKEDAGIWGRTVPGQELALEGTEPISTNFWIFTPAIFPILAEGFGGFWQALIEFPGTQPEFLIPAEVNRALGEGTARVKGMPTQDRFLGITHPDDREWVVRGLGEMTEEGRYPSPLWG
ncbi:MAG: NTP transferase domain-containing protein [Gemmatimonadota bacterium]